MVGGRTVGGAEEGGAEEGGAEEGGAAGGVCEGWAGWASGSADCASAGGATTRPAKAMRAAARIERRGRELSAWNAGTGTILRLLDCAEGVVGPAVSPGVWTPEAPAAFPRSIRRRRGIGPDTLPTMTRPNCLPRPTSIGCTPAPRRLPQRVRGLFGAGIAAGLSAVLLSAAGLSGCAIAPMPGARSVTLESKLSQARYEPTFSRLVFLSDDGVTADFFLTDLPDEALAPDAPLAGLSGNLMYVKLFVQPAPGMTPIDDGACSVIVNLLVIADGRVGRYGGGGFMLPWGTPKSQQFGGTLDGGTLRLLSAASGFRDPLGPVDLTASFRATRDAAMARRLAARYEALLRGLTPVKVDAGSATGANPPAPMR
jgi:hypothetical protein